MKQVEHSRNGAQKIQVLFADDEVNTLIADFRDVFPEFDFIPQSILTKEAVLESLKEHPEITVVILDLLDSRQRPKNWSA
ncbi:hypothetical protein HYR99_40710 [Candidatus Poribacteria bacterium]|nr:hypothetical protein [Candidatus Poribacteria bacterium]